MKRQDVTEYSFLLDISVLETTRKSGISKKDFPYEFVNVHVESAGWEDDGGGKPIPVQLETLLELAKGLPDLVKGRYRVLANVESFLSDGKAGAKIVITKVVSTLK